MENNDRKIEFNLTSLRKFAFILIAIIAVMLIVFSFANLHETDDIDESMGREGEVAEFEDSRFETIFRDNNGYSSGEPIYVEDLEEMDTVFLFGSGQTVESLEDLRKFTYLDRLEIKNIDIVNPIDISELNTITRINFSKIDLDKIQGLSELDLTVVYLEENNLTEVPEFIYGMNTLVNLNLSNNAITNVDELFGLSWLRTLDLSNNNIESIDVAARSYRLESIILDYNPLRSLENTYRLEAVESMTARHTLIENTQFVLQMPSLDSLDLSGTEANLEHLGQSKRVSVLYLYDTEISEEDGNNISQMVDLHSIYLDPEVDREFLTFLIDDFMDADVHTKSFLISSKYNLEGN